MAFSGQGIRAKLRIVNLVSLSCDRIHVCVSDQATVMCLGSLLSRNEVIAFKTEHSEERTCQQ